MSISVCQRFKTYQSLQEPIHFMEIYEVNRCSLRLLRFIGTCIFAGFCPTETHSTSLESFKMC